MPLLALGFAVAPSARQTYGDGLADHVKAKFRDASLMAVGVMVVFALASHIAPEALVGIFTTDSAVIAVGEEYLRIVSWNYVASGLVFVASSMFQAMGNTLPSLISSGVRVVLIVGPAP